MSRLALIALAFAAAIFSPAALAQDSSSEDDCENPAYDEVCESQTGINSPTGTTRSGMKYVDRSGVRVGVLYAHGLDEVSDHSPVLSVLGGEYSRTFGDDGPMRFLLVGNVVVVGLDQGIFLPNLNTLAGIELQNNIQFGVGANLSPVDVSGRHRYAQLVAAVGKTTQVGQFSVPVHLTVVPSSHFTRVAVTSGVNF